MNNCQIEQQITKTDEQILTDLFVKKMSENQLMAECIFHKNQKNLSAFIHLTVLHGVKHGKIITCRSSDGKIIASAMVYDRPTDKDLTFGNIIKDYGIFRTIAKVFKVGLGNLVRLTDMENKYQKYEIKEPHIYILMLASNEKGSGNEVLEFIKQQYGDRIIYLESSVPKNDHAYYRNRGFTEFARVTTSGFEQVLFIRQPKI